MSIWGMSLEQAAEQFPLEEDGTFPDELMQPHWRQQHQELLKQTRNAGSNQMWATAVWCRNQGLTHLETLTALLQRFSSETSLMGIGDEQRAAFLTGMCDAVYPITRALDNLDWDEEKA